MVYSQVVDERKKTVSQVHYRYDAFGRRTVVQDADVAASRTMYDGLTFDAVKVSPVHPNGMYADYLSGAKYSENRESTTNRYFYIDDGQTYDGKKDRVCLGFDCQTNANRIDITKSKETPAFARVNYGLIGFRVVRNASEDDIFNNYINDDRVRCREMPGLNGRILGMFNKGDELELIDEVRFNKTDNYSWCYVRMKSGFYGWMYGEYVSKKK